MTELLANQGPLAHVWLASNYDKRLSKAQLLKTNLVSSSELISNRPIRPGANLGQTHQQSSSSTANDQSPITLRLSGQLLLGVVKIYSRKTKYLLDDIQEVLNKLKHSFTYASGASLGSAAAQVNVPASHTSLPNVNRITLQDQVTNLDLLYQEDLNLDDEPAARPAALLNRFAESSSSNVLDATADTSIEIARGVEASEDFDLGLDFDIDMDDSVEQGRDAQAPMSDSATPDHSLLDIDPKGPSPLDMGQPLETIDELRQLPSSPAVDAQSPPSPQQNEPAPRLRPARRLVGRSEEGVRTTKKRVVLDSPDELERGLPLDVLRSIQHLQTHGRFNDEHLTLHLTQSEKLQLINEIAAPSTKRRRIWNLDTQLSDAAHALAEAERQQHQSNENEESPLDYDLDFDLSMPSLESDDRSSSIDASQDSAVSNVETTSRAAAVLRSAFLDEPTTTLDGFMAKDMHVKADDTLPLGAVGQTDTHVTINKRREATKGFFEMLVLATHDCVSLHQTLPDHILIGDELVIRPKDNLATKFL